MGKKLKEMISKSEWNRSASKNAIKWIKSIGEMRA
jgi:hypothetical protein